MFVRSDFIIKVVILLRRILTSALKETIKENSFGEVSKWCVQYWYHKFFNKNVLLLDLFYDTRLQDFIIN